MLFVDGALPGEVVEIDVRRRHRSHADAVVTEVREPSAARRTPRCEHRLAGCGGCDWMHLAATEQHTAKVEIVRESLARVGRFNDGSISELVQRGGAVTPVAYRTGLRIVGDPDGRPSFREHQSHRPVAVDGCPVAVPELSQLLAAVRLSPGREASLRVSSAFGTVTAFGHRGARLEGLPADAALGPRAILVEVVAGRELRVSAASFFQAGVQGAEMLVAAVSRSLPEAASAGHAVDAYGGVGLFGATALADAERLTLLESSRTACADATANLERSHRGRSTVRRLDVARWSTRDTVDVLVADPARAGLGAGGVGAVVASQPAVICLVSCDPAAAARDLRGLVDGGYRAERVEVLDLFPNTHHVETVARLVRR